MTELGVECHFPPLLTPQLCDSVPCSYFSFGVMTRILLFYRTRGGFGFDPLGSFDQLNSTLGTVVPYWQCLNFNLSIVG